MYYGGQGVQQDLTKAVQLFQQSVSKNNAYAYANLGFNSFFPSGYIRILF